MFWSPNVQHHLSVLTDHGNTSVHHGMRKHSRNKWKQDLDSSIMEGYRKTSWISIPKKDLAQVWDLGSKILSSLHRMFKSWIGSCVLATNGRNYIRLLQLLPYVEKLKTVCLENCNNVLRNIFKFWRALYLADLQKHLT